MVWCILKSRFFFVEFCFQQFIDVLLLVSTGTTNLRQQPYRTGLLRGDVFRPLIAGRAQRPQVGQFVFPAKRLVLYMPHMEAYKPVRVGADLSGSQPAHLTCKAIPVEDFGTKLCGNVARELGPFLVNRLLFHHVLPWLQFRTVVVRQDRPPLFIPQLTEPSTVLRRSTCRFLDFVRFDHPPDVRQQESSNLLLGTNLFHRCPAMR